MSTLLATLFAWPQGIVVGNLLANIIWGLPAWCIILWRMERHHRQHMDELRKGRM